MPKYAYRCDGCGNAVESNVRGDRIPCECGLTASRRFVFQLASPFREHWNSAVGRFVSNRVDFEDQLKRTSEEQSVKTGMPVDIQPIDLQDRAACGITDAEVEEVKEARAKAGADVSGL